MEIIQKTEKDLNISQAYFQDCIIREMNRVQEIVDNASESCYRMIISFLPLYIAAYGIVIQTFVNCRWSNNIGIIITVFLTILFVIFLVARNHYKSYKRQYVFRKVMVDLEALYENVTINYLETKNILNGTNIVEYSRLLSLKYDKNLFCTESKCKVIKELLYLFFCALITIATCLVIIFL